MTLAVIPQSPARRSPGAPAHDRALARRRAEFLFAQWIEFIPRRPPARLARHAARNEIPPRTPFRAPHLVEEMMMPRPRPGPKPASRSTSLCRIFLERQDRRHTSPPGRPTASRTPPPCSIDYRTMEVRAAVGSAEFPANQHPRPGRRPARPPLARLRAQAVHLRARARRGARSIPTRSSRTRPPASTATIPKTSTTHFAGPIRARRPHPEPQRPRRRSRIAPRSRNAISTRSCATPALAASSRSPTTDSPSPSAAPKSPPEEIAALYAMLANRGVCRPLRKSLTIPPRPARPSSRPRPLPHARHAQGRRSVPTPSNVPLLVEAARPVAWKTGTSFSYRDAWCAGVFDNYVLVVWVGNFDGAVQPRVRRTHRRRAAPFLGDRRPPRAASPRPPSPASTARPASICARSISAPSPA